MDKRTIILRTDQQKNLAIEWLKNYRPDPDKPWQVTFEVYKKKKTNSQRNYWHKIIDIMAPHFGYTSPEMKAEIKKLVLGQKTYMGLDGREKERDISSEELDREGYSKLIDHTIRLAAEEGLIIPDHRYE